MDNNTNSSKYSLAKIDLKNPKNAHDFQILLSGNNKKVLELGTATGYISKILKKQGCHVTGIEINQEWAKEASQYVDRMIIGNIEDLSYDNEFNNEKFDVILVGDVLEHLKDPVKILEHFHSLLNENGYLICSIPNISYAPIRLKLLNGELLYQSTGTLDESHLHFYTLENILLMLDKANFRITKLYRVKEDFYLHHRTDVKAVSFSDYLIDSLLQDPESETFQFVFKCESQSKVEKSTREFLIEKFPRNYVSDKLKFKIDEDMQKISALKQTIKDKDQYMDQVINDKDQYMAQTIKDKDQYMDQVINDKDQYMAQTIKDKDQYHENALKDFKNQIKEIKSSKSWKITHLFHKNKK